MMAEDVAKNKPMKKTTLITLIFLLSIQLIAQQRIDGNFAFQTDPAKKYSLYIPSTYSAGTANKMMLGLHPFNTSRWDAESWCDTLIGFAETNGLILVCPDGGADGQVDDAIDTAFTSALLDSARIWYNIDTEKTYVMGFSWGSRTTYTYGLSRPTVFGGYLPIGAAITNTIEVTVPLQNNSADKAVYIIHGSFDSPNTRFYPVRDSLIAKGAIVNTNLLSGVGHTIDFANRDNILSTGYKWIDSVNCYQLTTDVEAVIKKTATAVLFPNPVTLEETLKLEINSDYKEQEAEIMIFDLQGKQIKKSGATIFNGINVLEKDFNNLPRGTYMVSIKLNKDRRIISQKIIFE